MRKTYFKHLYAEEPKPEFNFLDISKPYTSGESQYMACSTTQFAYSVAAGGGPVAVYGMDKPGRGKSKTKLVSVHSGKVLDLAFNPFVESLLATASEDNDVKVTKVEADMEDIKENISTEDVKLEGHGKRAHLLKWHPGANNVIASTSWDKCVKLWDVSTADCVKTWEDLGDLAYSMDWNKNGSLLALTTKGKELTAIDPRTSEAAWSCESFEGTKSSKVFWVPGYNWIGATGFNKQARRMLRIWDLAKIGGKPLYSEVLDQMSGVLMPYVDYEHSVLYLFGKGDSSISYYQLGSKKKVCELISSFRGKAPQKGGAWVPKRGLDVGKIEIQRFYKLTKDSVVPLSFKLDRKNKKFSSNVELYPNCYAGLPSMTAEEYMGGDNKDPVEMSMDPAMRGDREEAKFEKKKSYAELSAENEELKAKIAELEAKLKADEE